MKLLDSSVAIDYLRGRPEAIGVVDSTLRAGEWIGASEIVRFEVLSGAKRGEAEAIEDLFSGLGWIPVDETVSRQAGALARKFRSSHVGIEDGDYLIAATALELGADLLTTNVKHFPMLAGLTSPY